MKRPLLHQPSSHPETGDHRLAAQGSHCETAVHIDTRHLLKCFSGAKACREMVADSRLEYTQQVYLESPSSPWKQHNQYDTLCCEHRWQMLILISHLPIQPAVSMLYLGRSFITFPFCLSATPWAFTRGMSTSLATIWL